jgi:site-specific DNA-cytosine methylase
MIRAVDICCGGGGWACAARGLPIEIVLAVDLWEPAVMTYRLNHPWAEVWQEDLRNLRETCLAAELDRKSPTVMSQCSRRDAELAIVDDRLPGGMRVPEWQELATIQGFPTDYLFYGSPTDVMKQVGRAVPIPLARAILERICEMRNPRAASALAIGAPL